jgi:heme/copper-type cytochrome/quinol oxidase subunit 4
LKVNFIVAVLLTFSPFLVLTTIYFESNLSIAAVFTLQNINFPVTNIQKEGGLQVP